VKDFADIYGEIDNDPALWEKRFRESTYYEQYILSRMRDAEAGARNSGVSPALRPAVAPSRIAPRANPLRQFIILMQRYFELVVRDKVLLTVLLAVMPLMGVLLAVIAQPSALVGDSAQRIAQIVSESNAYSIAGQAQVVLMMMALAAIFVGLFAASFELVRERAIYRRERMVNLRLGAYLASKFVVLAGFAALQVMALIVVVAFRVQFPFEGVLLPGPLEMYLTLLLASAAGICFGLFVSALVASQNSVIYVVLLAVFAQIMFGGVLFNVAKPLSALTLTRWTVEALGSTVNLPALNDLGQIEVRRTVDGVDPITGQKVQREVVYRDKLTTSFNVDYAHDAGHLLSRWAILIAFTLLFALGTTWAQSKWSRPRTKNK
ncbi:MAG TPA: ABC transporter permease, partial [Anaerolineae bacterium]|nr:ABC transporter permease [Anaerolineae bacterium]